MAAIFIPFSLKRRKQNAINRQRSFEKEHPQAVRRNQQGQNQPCRRSNHAAVRRNGLGDDRRRYGNHQPPYRCSRFHEHPRRPGQAVQNHQNAVCAYGLTVFRGSRADGRRPRRIGMRSYNETVSEKEALHFYGMDVQRFDNNKEYLFSVIDQTHPELSAEYSEVFAQLTDENRNSLDEAALNSAKESVSEFIEKLDTVETDIVDSLGQPAFDFAKECAKTIYACCEVQLSDNYNATRDQYMYEKVEWFLQHGDNTVLFINGHNGHIGKSSVAGYTCLGELLSDNLGNGYYSIGTDAQETQFNSQKGNGEFEVLEVSNSNDLNNQFSNADNGQYFIDFASATSDEVWEQIQSSKQSITTLNVSLSGMQKMLKSAYTVTITPQDIFDSMIVFQSVTPSTILSE